MDTMEFEHTLQVENQFEQVQADIQAEADNPNIPIALSAPVTLSSNGVPPFGSPTVSTIAEVPSSANRVELNYSLQTTTYQGPTIWDHGNLCLVNSSCANSGSNSRFWYNWVGNNSELNVNSFTGSNDQIYINISGNHDLILFPETGSNEVVITIFLVGNSNTMFFNYTGSSYYGTTLNVYGQSNIIHFGKSSGSNLKFVVNFIGQTFYPTTTCPLANTTSTNQFVIDPGSSGSSDSAYVNWYNDVGYNHTSIYNGVWPGGSGSVHFQQNYTTGSQLCAWYAGTSYFFNNNVGSGLGDTVSNRYYPAVDVAFEEGAVVAVWPSNTSTMLSGPQMTITPTSNGPSVNLTLDQFVVSNFTEESGSGTVGVQTHLLSLQHVTVSVATPAAYTGAKLSLPEHIYLITAAPAAWINWALQYPSIFPQGASIVGDSQFAHGCGLLQKTPVCLVEIPMYADSLTLTMATVEVQVT